MKKRTKRKNRSEEELEIEREAGRQGNELGKKNERKLIQAYLHYFNKDLFPWIIEVRKATKKEDSERKDVIIATDAGDIWIQIKSSKDARKNFLRRWGSRPILCFAVSQGEAIADLVIRTLPEIVTRYCELKLQGQSR